MRGRILVTGATGFIGGRPARRLTAEGWQVRALVRNPTGEPPRLRRGGSFGGGRVRRAGARPRRHADDLSRRAGRPAALGAPAQPPRDRPGPRGAWAAPDVPPGCHGRWSSERVLPDASIPRPAASGDDRARLAEEPDQPIAIDDTVSYLVTALEIDATSGQEIQIGGRDVLAYGEMLDRMAQVLGIARRPRIPIPLLTPWRSWLWIGLVTPVDAVVARPLVEGLAEPTVVTDPANMDLFDIEPIGFDEALRLAVAEDPDLAVAA